MPTYEYICTECGNLWEELQKITEPALEDCPKCHKHSAKRQISGGNFILKGGGWYADLYSSTKPPKDRTEGSSSSVGAPEKSDTTKASGGESAAAPAKESSTATTSAAASTTPSTGTGTSSKS